MVTPAFHRLALLLVLGSFPAFCRAAGAGGQSDRSDLSDQQFAVALIDGMRAARASLRYGSATYEDTLARFTEGVETSSLTETVSVKWKGDNLWFRRVIKMPNGEPSLEPAQVCIRTAKDIFINDDSGMSERFNWENDNLTPAAFDPRILGVYGYLAPQKTLQNTLSHPRRVDPQLMQREVMVEGQRASYIRFDYDTGMDHHFYIGNTVGFPVYRHWFLNEQNIWKCDYNDGEPLPHFVTHHHNLDREGKMWLFRTIQQLDLDADTPVDDSTFDLKNLDMDIGEDMVDVEAMLAMGYWDGSQLVGRRHEAFQNASASGVLNPPVAAINWPRWISIIIALAAAAGWIMYRSSKRI